MAFLIPMPISELDSLPPDVVNDTDFKSISLIPTDSHDNPRDGAFLLMDANENLTIKSPEMFCMKLNCSDNDKIKVVSIFGNTGDGKSHTMNHAFFGGKEVFKTSPEQSSCTIGVYAAMRGDVLCLDTEGLLGTTAKSNRRMRMLLKILAISDIVIYRTRSERLHSDMYEFLGTASRAFCTHFAQALQSLAIPGTAKTLGPAVIVFHETRHTKPLENSLGETTEEKLRESFGRLNYDTNAFSSLRYVGIQTASNNSTDYSKIITALRAEIINTTVRSHRQPNVVFTAMNALNLKFSGEIVENTINPFPEQYFTCTVHCEACHRRCQRSMGHVIDGENHLNAQPCVLQHQYENKVYLCKTCYKNGKEVIVTIRAQTQSNSSLFSLAKYAWKGSVIECPNCGEIYRARQYWYGNKSPEEISVRSQIVHVWKGGNITAKGPVHSAQMVVDGVSYISEAISNLSAQPTKALSNWIADRCAPSYWKPNHEILRCFDCKKNFENTGLRKHHCRNCGEGFCNACSLKSRSVPQRGWEQPVRVCNDCYQELAKSQGQTADDNEQETTIDTNSNRNNTAGPPSCDEGDILVRKYGEQIYNAVSTVASVAIEFPKEIIKDTARPAYWIPDAESPHCFICKMPFGTAEQLELAKVNGMLTAKTADTTATTTTTAMANTTTATKATTSKAIIGDCRRHHCRRCGQGVCENCSKARRAVPERGWLTEVRVCDSCACIQTETDAAANVESAKSKVD